MQRFFQPTIFVFLFSFPRVNNFQQYSCKRLTIEKERCLVYNYNHPDCQKWDHSRCPPPTLVRELSHCVSYKCTSLSLSSEWPLVPPVKQTTQKTPKRLEEDAHLLSEKIELLREDLERLRLEDLHHLNEQQWVLNQSIATQNRSVDIQRADLQHVEEDLVSLQQEFNYFENADKESRRRFDSFQRTFSNLKRDFIKTTEAYTERFQDILSNITTLQALVQELEGAQPIAKTDERLYVTSEEQGSKVC